MFLKKYMNYIINMTKRNKILKEIKNFVWNTVENESLTKLAHLKIDGLNLHT